MNVPGIGDVLRNRWGLSKFKPPVLKEEPLASADFSGARTQPGL